MAQAVTWMPTDEQLTCRDLQHSWSPYTARWEGQGKRRGAVRVLRCDRCGSVKEQHLSHEGYITRTTMFYPTGYLRPAHLGRMTRRDRAALRLENIAQEVRIA